MNNSTTDTNAEQKRSIRPAGAAQRTDNTIEIDLMELFRYLLTKWHILAAALLAGAVIAGLYTMLLVKPTYTATSKLYMVSNSENTTASVSDFNVGNSLSSDYEELLRLRPILQEIIEEEGLDYTYKQMRSMISVSTISNTRILNINVVTNDPQDSMVIANALADKAVEKIPELMSTATPNIAERAILPEEKSGPSLKKNVVIGALIGMVLAAAVLILLFMRDDTLTTAEDVQKKLGMMPLTIVPELDSQRAAKSGGKKKKNGKKETER